MQCNASHPSINPSSELQVDGGGLGSLHARETRFSRTWGRLSHARTPSGGGDRGEGGRGRPCAGGGSEASESGTASDHITRQPRTQSAPLPELRVPSELQALASALL
mmetsp:Transcript_6635/g.13435  ORF Transcript_6635/g.13435 Transcript_6635/m.13435 type:complete len:107 (-) Transcript_6635:278-598(-)